MSLKIILIILLIHWFADFVLQTDWQAKNKSKNDKALSFHVLTYSLCWLVFGLFMWKSIQIALGFAILVFLFHWWTDYFTSRLNTYLYNKGDIHNFFVSIGFDQWLHYLQLFGLYQLFS